MRKRNYYGITLHSVFVLSSLPILGFILKYGVNMPVYDQWGISEIFLGPRTWLPNFPIVFAPHNESRMVIPKLIWFALGKLSGWNIRLELICSWAFATATGAILLSLAKVTFPKWPSALISCAVVSTAMVFNPAQWFNFLRGDELCAFIAAFCASLIARMCANSWSIGRILFLSALLSALATITFAHGVLCTLISPIALVLSRPRELKGAWFELSAYLACTGLLGILTLWTLMGYSLPPPLLPGHSATKFFFSVIGNPWILASAENAVVLTCGGLLVIVLVAIIVRICRRGVSTELGPWVGLLVFGLLSCLGLAVLRAEAYEGTDSRGVTPSIFVSIALSALAWGSVPRFKLERLAAVLLLAVTLFIYGSNLWRAAEIVRPYRSDLLAGKAVLHYLPFGISQEHFDRLLAPEHLSRHRANAVALNSLGLLSPPLARSARIDSARVRARFPCTGSFDSLVSAGPGRMIVNGWATDASATRPADAVLLTTPSADQGSNVVAVAKMGQTRIDLEEKVSPTLLYAGWNAVIDRSMGSIGQTLDAWAFDTDTAAVRPLCGQQRIPAL